MNTERMQLDNLNQKQLLKLRSDLVRQYGKAQAEERERLDDQMSAVLKQLIKGAPRRRSKKVAVTAGEVQ